MPTDLETLMEMGFPENRAQKALARSGYKGFQPALDWLIAHEDDADIDEAFVMAPGHTLTAHNSGQSSGAETDGQHETTPGCDGQGTPGADGGPGASGADGEPAPVAKSIKCEDCGKLMGSDANVMMHSARTGHTNFSESTEEVKPLSEEEKREQMQKLQEKLKQKREERAQKEKEEALEKEKVRRKQGRNYSEIKQKHEELEMKKIAEERRREKMEEKLARQKVKEQIERDKITRAKLFGPQSDKDDAAPATSVDTASVCAPAPAAAPAPAPATTIQKDYDTTRLQIRLPNGQPLTESFSVNEPLASVRLYVHLQQNKHDLQPPNFTFMTNYPRKVFSDDDMQISLKELGLVPSAVLMVKQL